MTTEEHWRRSNGGRVDGGGIRWDGRMEGGEYILLGLIFSRGVPGVVCDSEHLLLIPGARTFFLLLQ
jgi:hypothetical protein